MALVSKSFIADASANAVNVLVPLYQPVAPSCSALRPSNALRPLVGAAEHDRVRQVLREDPLLLGEARASVLFALVEQAPETADAREHRRALAGAGGHGAAEREEHDAGEHDRERDQPERRGRGDDEGEGDAGDRRRRFRSAATTTGCGRDGRGTTRSRRRRRRARPSVAASSDGELVLEIGELHVRTVREQRVEQLLLVREEFGFALLEPPRARSRTCAPSSASSVMVMKPRTARSTIVAVTSRRFACSSMSVPT